MILHHGATCIVENTADRSASAVQYIRLLVIIKGRMYEYIVLVTVTMASVAQNIDCSEKMASE